MKSHNLAAYLTIILVVGGVATISGSMFGKAVSDRAKSPWAPKFSAGDCVQRIKPNCTQERWEDPDACQTTQYIIEIGDKKYHTRYVFFQGDRRVMASGTSSSEFNWIDEDYKKIECPALSEL